MNGDKRTNSRGWHCADGQLELPFGVGPLDTADRWREERAWQVEKLCHRLGLPLQQKVEVRLMQGPLLRGRLHLAEESLWMDGERDRIALRIGATIFRLGEVESVVRLEED